MTKKKIKDQEKNQRISTTLKNIMFGRLQLGEKEEGYFLMPENTICVV